MERKTRERIFREVLAAIIGSNLKSADLRHLANILGNDSSFTNDLARMIFEISTSKEVSRYPEIENNFQDQANSSGNGLVDLSYKVVQRKRLSKTQLVNIFNEIASRIVSPSLVDRHSSRELLEIFFERASTLQTRDLLKRLGMDVGNDPYLGGISRRSK